MTELERRVGGGRCCAEVANAKVQGWDVGAPRCSRRGLLAIVGGGPLKRFLDGRREGRGELPFALKKIVSFVRENIAHCSLPFLHYTLYNFRAKVEAESAHVCT